MARNKKSTGGGGRTMNTSRFTEGIVSLIIGVILLTAVAIPIIQANPVAEGFAMADTLNTIISTIPIFIGIALIVSVVGMFISRRS